MENLIIVVSIIFLTACGASKKIIQDSSMEKPQIENTQWTLIEFDGKPIPESVAGKVFIELDRKEHRLSGSNGCNRVMGDYTITHGTQIKFSKIASTMMACNNQNWNENEFNKILEISDNFTISDNKLMLNVEKRTPLAVFVKTTKENITNKYWKLKELNGKEVQMVDNQEREQYFILKDDGTISGFAGCNPFSGNFSLEKDKSKIKFDNMLSTLRACPDIKVNETEFLEVFKLTDNYSINNDVLTLNVGKRAPLAVFEVVYF